MDDAELNAIRQARLAELQKTNNSAPQNDAKITVLNQILDTGAKERLSRIKIVRPDRYDMVENYLVKLVNMGGVSKKLTENDIVQILNNLSKGEAPQKIVFNRRELSDDEDDFFD